MAALARSAFRDDVDLLASVAVVVGAQTIAMNATLARGFGAVLRIELTGLPEPCRSVALWPRPSATLGPPARS